MKYVLIFVLFVAVSACKKEQNRQLLGAYFKFKANGQELNISDGTGLNANTFRCVIQGDTGLYINVEKQTQGAGFFIKGHPIKDTTYILDSLQLGYYVPASDYRRFYTTNINKGLLTIKKGTFQAKDMLNTLEGTFSYVAEDTFSHNIRTITEGSFLMERKDE